MNRAQTIERALCDLLIEVDAARLDRMHPISIFAMYARDALALPEQAPPAIRKPAAE